MSRNPAEPPGTERSSGATEVELKLACDPELLPAILASPILTQRQRDPGKDLSLTAVYYDTDQYDLRRSGTVLRIRTDGSRFVMTMKSKQAAQGNALERTEKKLDVATIEPESPDLRHLLPAELHSIIEDRTLLPVCRTEVDRHVLVVDTPSAAVEVALDEGRIVAGERTEALCEIELELLGGQLEGLFQLAGELVREFPLRPSIRSKSERGFDLAADSTPNVTKADEIVFAGDETLDAWLFDLFRSIVQHLLENQPAAEDGRAAEGLHQYRVALRRLRSLLALLGRLSPSPKLTALREDAKWLMSNLNDARDWDVFAESTFPKAADACRGLDGFAELERFVGDQRHEARARAHAAMTARRNARFQIELGLWIERRGWREDGPDAAGEAPARSFAAAILDRLDRKVRKRGKKLHRLSVDELHRFRIAVKKLRYAADFCMPLFPQSKDTRRYGKALSRLQDQLGLFNDLAVTGRLVQSLTALEMTPSARLAAGAIIGWQSCRLEHQEDSLAVAWREFRDLDLSL